MSESPLRRTVKNLDLLRQVTVTIFYAHEASPHRQGETGLTHSNILSENFMVMPSTVDTLDTSNLPTIRALWKKSVENHSEDDAPLFKHDETVQEKFARLLANANSGASKEMMLSFIDAAKYPVPSEFSVLLPEETKSFRQHVIATLVPFINTRNMLLRLEQALALPIRNVVIGHTRATGVDELRATLN